jgi:SAM-dependent methyltransferase
VWSFAADWEEALWAAATERLPADALDGRALAAAAAARSDRYTRARERLDAPMARRDRARDLAARALFFTVADAAKIAVPIAELAGRGLVPGTDPLQVLDVGAGCGAMTFGLATALPGRAIEVTAVDRDGDALAFLTAAARRIPREPRLGVRAIAGDVSAPLPAGPFDLVVAGTVLNELAPDARLPLVAAMLARLRPGGAAILVEPALRETARALHALRDAVISGGHAHVFAPCTRTIAPCPALADEKDWCHEDRPFAPPPRLAQLARNTGLRREGLKFAYLTLRLDAAPLVDAPGRRALRVVSEPLDQKGTVERILCGEEGRERRRILRREASESKHALNEARRGDVILDAGRDLERVRPAE